MDLVAEGFCESCFEENEAKDEVRRRGSVVTRCLVCGSENVRWLTTNDRDLRRIIRALVRKYYSEWDYNHHIGGSSIQDLLYGKNSIFSLDVASTSAIHFEEAYLPIEEDYGWYPTDPDLISLGGGYWDGGILSSVGWNLDDRLYEVLERSFNENWFDVLPLLKPLIEKILPDVRSTIDAGLSFHRARMGTASRLLQKIPMFRQDLAYTPFSGDGIGAPPTHLAREGRLNRARVRVLYVATDVETAVAEMRPHPGHLVSVGKFQTTREIAVADLTRTDVRHFLNDDRLEDLRLICSFDRLLNVPVQPENSALYLVTQLLSDAFRIAGVQGVLFRSSIGPGKNFACFEPDALKYESDSGGVVRVESLNYRLVSLDMPDVDDYVEDATHPLATLFAGIASTRPR